MGKFWTVWREGSGFMQFKHETEGGARAEAERLATQNQGITFHVLGLVDSCKVKTVFWASEHDQNQVPF